MPFGRVFETLAWGRRHVVMGANQIDRYGNQNLSAFGPLQHPTRQMFGVRGAPGNTINHATSYWVGNHSKRVFCETVDVVSRHRLGQGRRRQPGVPVRQHLSGWCPTSASSTSTGRTARCARCRCIPASRPTRSRENTSFEVHGLDDADDDPAADRRRAATDPRGHRSEGAARQGNTVA